MANMNHVILAGNLTGDPKITRTPHSGTPSATMTIAVNRRRKNGKDDVSFVPLKALGRLAEIAEAYLFKGSPLLIEGRLQTRTYEKDDERRYFTEILVNELQLLSRTPHNSEAGVGFTAHDDDADVDDEGHGAGAS